MVNTPVPSQEGLLALSYSPYTILLFKTWPTSNNASRSVAPGKAALLAGGGRGGFTAFELGEGQSQQSA